MYYVCMTDGHSKSANSRIIAMSDKQKYIRNFISFFFRDSRNYEIICSDDNQKDPDLYTIVKVSKENGIYLPIWIIQYIEKEFDIMSNNFANSIGCMYTICKNNGDTTGMSYLENIKEYFLKKGNSAIKDKIFDDYVYMHWICVVPFDKQKMETLDRILSSIEYMKDTEAGYIWRLNQDYT